MRWVIKYCRIVPLLSDRKIYTDISSADINLIFRRLEVWEKDWKGQTYNYWVEEQP